jgi:hypothetical protein
MKKLFVLLLIFLMMFSFASCGGGEDTPDIEDTDIGNEVSEGDESDVSGSENSIQPGDTLNTDDLYMSGDDYELEDEYDFVFTHSETFGMSGILKKLDYSDYEGMEPELQARMEAAVAASVGGEYDIFTSYEPEEGSEIDLLTCAAAMENGDAAGIYFEGGAYHVVGDANYQYITCFTQNFEEVSDANTKAIMEFAKKVLGLTLDEKNLETAIEKAFGQSNETKDEYTLLGETYASGNGYDELIRIAVVGSVTEEDEVSYYACFERERCYE